LNYNLKKKKTLCTAGSVKAIYLVKIILIWLWAD